MAHVLFVDLTQAGVHTLRRAVELGHVVTLVRGHAVRYYKSDESIEELVAGLHHVVDVVDTADEPTLFDAISVVHAERPVDAVVSQCDPIFVSLANVCERLGLPWTSRQGIRNARDKACTRRLLAEAGLASARYAFVHDTDSAARAAESIGYPLVLKPVSGIDSIMTFHVAGPRELRTAAADFLAATTSAETPEETRRLLRSGMLVEEYLDGELVSAEIGRRLGTNWSFLVSGRSRARENDCVEMGAALPAPVSAARAEACFTYAHAVCDAIGLDFGVFHVELMLTDRGPVLVEVNPRVMGGVMTVLYKLLTGVDFSDYVLDVHLGRQPAPLPDQSFAGTITARRLMPREDTRLADDLDLSWVTDPAWGIVSYENFFLEPRAAVRKQQTLGRFSVLDTTWDLAMDRADQLIELFEKALGVPLFRSAPALRSTAPHWT